MVIVKLWLLISVVCPALHYEVFVVLFTQKNGQIVPDCLLVI